jgi:hypothetical protein
VEVVAADLAGLPMLVGPGGGKHPLPGPLAAGVRVLAREGGGELDPAGAPAEVVAVLGVGGSQVGPNGWAGLRREDRRAVARAFPSSDDQAARADRKKSDLSRWRGAAPNARPIMVCTP